MESEIFSDKDRIVNPDLPQGWIQVKFIESVKKISLTDKKLKQSEYLEIGDIPVVDQGQSLVGGYTNRLDLKNSSTEPIIIFGDHTRIIKYINFDFVAGAEGVKPFHAQPWFDPKFLYFLLNSINLPDKGYARHFQYLEKIYLPLPPLSEQHRIVTKIEELFTQLDAGVTSLKKVQAQLKRYRQAVLKAAFEGGLTQEWREAQNGLIPVQKILEQITIERQKLANINGKKIQPPLPISKDESVKLPDTPRGWHWVRLNELSGLITDGKHGDCRDENDTGYFFLSAKDIKNGKLHYENARQINKDDFLEVYNRTKLEAGDVVITNSGTIGRIAVIENNPLVTHTSFQKSVAIIKPVRNFFNSKYLAFYLLAVVQTIVKKSKGTAQKNLLIRDLKDFLIAVPTLEEQNAIVSEIERYFSQIDHLELTITTSLLQADILRQSILKRAFEGKLVPQNPTDEPASILLERIKAEKARHTTETKKGKTLQPKSPKRRLQNDN